MKKVSHSQFKSPTVMVNQVRAAVAKNLLPKVVLTHANELAEQIEQLFASVTLSRFLISRIKAQASLFATFHPESSTNEQVRKALKVLSPLARKAHIDGILKVFDNAGASQAKQSLKSQFAQIKASLEAKRNAIFQRQQALNELYVEAQLAFKSGKKVADEQPKVIHKVAPKPELPKAEEQKNLNLRLNRTQLFAVIHQLADMAKNADPTENDFVVCFRCKPTQNG